MSNPPPATPDTSPAAPVDEIERVMRDVYAYADAIRDEQGAETIDETHDKQKVSATIASIVRGHVRRLCDNLPNTVPAARGAGDDAQRDARPRELDGTWPLDCVQRAFVDGGRWWQFHHNGSTAFSSERVEMEAEAVRRYGHPSASPAPTQAVVDDAQREAALMAEAHAANDALEKYYRPVNPGAWERHFRMTEALARPWDRRH